MFLKTTYNPLSLLSKNSMTLLDMITKEEQKQMQFLTDKGIKTSFDNAHEEWRSMALGCVRDVCLKHKTFTVNDVRALVKLSTLKTHDNRAMGGVMKTAQKMRWLEPTGESIPSVVGHKVHIQVWKSLLFKQ